MAQWYQGITLVVSSCDTRSGRRLEHQCCPGVALVVIARQVKLTGSYSSCEHEERPALEACTVLLRRRGLLEARIRRATVVTVAKTIFTRIAFPP